MLRPLSSASLICPYQATRLIWSEIPATTPETPTRLTAQPQRVLIIGLDGATWDLLQPMFERGVTPNLKQLLDDGSRGVLTSVFPPVTAPAWSSMYTGVNPGKHGVYDFMRRVPGSYQVAPIDASYRDGKSIFRLVSEAGGQAFALNAPLSFPPEEVDGAIVPGLPTPGFSIAPASLAPDFLAAVPDYEAFPASMRHFGGQTQQLYDVTPDYVDKTVRAFSFLNRRFEGWRLGFVHFQITDIAMHFAWGDEKLLDEVYRTVDAGVGRILAELPEDTAVVVMSDHGHGPLESYLQLNEWLRSRGYLKFKRTPLSLAKGTAYRADFTPARIYRLAFRLGLGGAVRSAVHQRTNLVLDLLRRVFVSMDDVDWSRSKAYAVGNVGQVYMNVRGREPQGILEPGPELERETERLRSELAALKQPDSGKPIAREVVRGSDLFKGGRVAEAPDLLLVPYDFTCWAFAQNEFATSQWLTRPHDNRNGHHRMEGVIGVAGAGAARGVQIDASILDIASTVLSLLGVPLPSYLDGRVLSAAFAADVASTTTATETETPIEAGARTGYSAEDAAVVARRLDDLGYL
jgi:predicted AlkP superfamily phosphohydrolase/phosphomutase